MDLITIVIVGANAHACTEVKILYRGPCMSDKKCTSDCISHGFQIGFCDKIDLFREHPCKCIKSCIVPSPTEGGDMPARQGWDVPAHNAVHTQDGSVQRSGVV